MLKVDSSIQKVFSGLLTLAVTSLLLVTLGALPVQGREQVHSGENRVAAKPASKKARVEREAPEKLPLQEPPGARSAAGGESSPGQINAKSALLVEVSTGTVLFEQNADELIEPASFTKVLSLFLVYEALKSGRIHAQDEVWVSEEAWRTGGSKMFVGAGTKVPLEELIKGIAVVSGNDACVAVAEHLSGSVSAFVDAMNQKARALGMSHSRFLNPHGLPADGQVTTARDMAALDTAYLRRFPEALQVHSMKEYTYNNITQFNRNRLLLRDATVDGLKTGFVAAAGYHLAATAQRDGMRLLAVVMGAPTPRVREREAHKLLNYGFRFFTLVKPFGENQPVTSLPVWKGMKDEVELFPVEPAAFLLPVSQKSALRYEVRTIEEAAAPIKVGEELGELIFFISDQPKKTIKLVSHEEIAEAGWLKRSWQTLLRIHKLDWRWFGGVVLGLVAVLGVLFLVANRGVLIRRRR